MLNKKIYFFTLNLEIEYDKLNFLKKLNDKYQFLLF